MPTDYFIIDIPNNTVYVEGCKDTEYLSSRPFGVITFSYVQLPDYVSDTNPVELYAYSDVAYSDLVFEESKLNGGGMVITKTMLQPGNLDLLEFTPSSYYAFVTGVTYTVSIRPHHDMLESTRVIITMPENLKFDPTAFGGNGCRITYTEGDCELVEDTNELILWNVFSERTAGMTTLKFIIEFADNPIGSREAGAWGARTEGLFERDKFFVVDGNTSEKSFLALPGLITSTLGYTEEMTFTDGTQFDFTFITEHDIPVGGYLKVGLPVEMAFPDDIVAANDQNLVMGPTSNNGPDQEINYHSLTSKALTFLLPDGHSTDNNPIQIQLKGVRTPRSFRPTSEFNIETLSPIDAFTGVNYIIDAGGTDITVTMSVMNVMSGIEITPKDLTNGAVTDYTISLDTFVFLEDGDIILLTNPPEISFGADGLTCSAVSPDPVGVTEASCENIDGSSFFV